MLNLTHGVRLTSLQDLLTINLLLNKIIVYGKQRERIISSPNGLIDNVLVLQTTTRSTGKMKSILKIDFNTDTSKSF